MSVLFSVKFPKKYKIEAPYYTEAETTLLSKYTNKIFIYCILLDEECCYVKWIWKKILKTKKKSENIFLLQRYLICTLLWAQYSVDE
jgi:hypothetical protein